MSGAQDHFSQAKVMGLTCVLPISLNNYLSHFLQFHYPPPPPHTCYLPHFLITYNASGPKIPQAKVKGLTCILPISPSNYLSHLFQLDTIPAHLPLPPQHTPAMFPFSLITYHAWGPKTTSLTPPPPPSTHLRPSPLSHHLPCLRL